MIFVSRRDLMAHHATPANFGGGKPVHERNITVRVQHGEGMPEDMSPVTVPMMFMPEEGITLLSEGMNVDTATIDVILDLRPTRYVTFVLLRSNSSFHVGLLGESL